MRGVIVRSPKIFRQFFSYVEYDADKSTISTSSTCNSSTRCSATRVRPLPNSARSSASRPRPSTTASSGSSSAASFAATRRNSTPVRLGLHLTAFVSCYTSPDCTYDDFTRRAQRDARNLRGPFGRRRRDASSARSLTRSTQHLDELLARLKASPGMARTRTTIVLSDAVRTRRDQRLRRHERLVREKSSARRAPRHRAGGRDAAGRVADRQHPRGGAQRDAMRGRDRSTSTRHRSSRFATSAKAIRSASPRTSSGTWRERGKQHNPVTGSGGMFVGRVAEIGESLRGQSTCSPATALPRSSRSRSRRSTSRR